MENALYSDPRVLEVAAVGVPDKRLGELVAAVVVVKPAYQGQVSETSLMSVAVKTYASPFFEVKQCTDNDCLEGCHDLQYL